MGLWHRLLVCRNMKIHMDYGFGLGYIGLDIAATAFGGRLNIWMIVMIFDSMTLHLAYYKGHEKEYTYSLHTTEAAAEAGARKMLYEVMGRFVGVRDLTVEAR